MMEGEQQPRPTFWLLLVGFLTLIVFLVACGTDVGEEVSCGDICVDQDFEAFYTDNNLDRLFDQFFYVFKQIILSFRAKGDG